MNAKELSDMIGKHVMVVFGELSVECEVLDAKSAYGNLRYQVKPVSGIGETWISSDRAQLVA